jgi:hypothetical protein
MKHSWTDFLSIFVVIDDKTSGYLIKTSHLENWLPQALEWSFKCLAMIVLKGSEF